ncbi:hypothetical protein DL95DRAFT_435253 [Leptodontidium sp. 2 PMI_412]|nr:hypothetical protein DL95DRAFT_435253 [Leptodontidium sp. 2 PMI_412]
MPQLKVVIIGGGVGGLTAAIALRQHPALHVELYEQATSFREIGALIGLAPNGLRTLEKLGVEDVLTDEIGFRNPDPIPMIYKHWKTGDTLSADKYHNVPEKRHQMARMHRASLQKALLKKLPSDVLHLGKRVVDVDVSDERRVIVTFEDSTSVAADLVIGADGIKSRVRKSFVPDHELKWTGDAIFRSTFPYELVKDIPDLPRNSTHFTGPRSWFFPSRMGKDEFGVTCSFPVNDQDPDAPFQDLVWNAPADVQTVQEAFKDFNPLVRAIADRIPSVRRYANVAGAGLKHWTFSNRVTLLGDAAHTHGGAFAAGASLAIDDAYALYLALSTTIQTSAEVSPERLAYALSLYETTRRPQSDRVLRVVHGMITDHRGRMGRFWEEGVEEPDEEFRQRVAARLDPVWLTEHDVEKTFEKVLTASREVGVEVARL